MFLFNYIDIIAFTSFIILVITISLIMSRKEDSPEDYFLGGRSFIWPLIGLSLVATNISTEQFVGLSGQGFKVGLAFASYSWTASVTMVFTAYLFLPKFLKSGVFTVPQFMGLRYNSLARTYFSIIMLISYIFITLAAILYSAGIILNTFFGINIFAGIIIIGLISGAYTIYGGLKAVVWSDLIQGIVLLIGGVLATLLGFHYLGANEGGSIMRGMELLKEVNGDKLHSLLPADHPVLPWTSVFFGGLWLAHLWYWGFNQFTVQRALGSKSLQEGQKGLIFGAFIKLFIPLIMVVPGIIAFQLYGESISSADQAYPYLIKMVMPIGLRGIVLAAIFGAVMSSVDSVLNSASTVFTFDIYKRYINKQATSKALVLVGRIVTGVVLIFAMLWAPVLSNLSKSGIYIYMKKFAGFTVPGVVAVFLFGFFSKRTPKSSAFYGLIMNIPIYAFLLVFFPKLPFLRQQMITFLIISLFMFIMTLINPLKDEIKYPVLEGMDMSSPFKLKVLSAVLIFAVAALYIIFW